MDEIPDAPSYEKIQAIGKQVYGSDSFRTTLHNNAEYDITIPSCGEEVFFTLEARSSKIVMRTDAGYRLLKEGE